MPQTIKNAEGEDVEVFTADEVAAKAEEAATAKVAEAQARADEEKESLRVEKEAELLAAQEELAKEKDKSRNFEITRKGKERADGKESDLAKTVEQLQKDLDGFRKQPIEEAKTDFVAKNIGSNKELKDKFDVFWGKLGADVKTKAEAEAAMTQAFMLASDGRKPDTATRMTQASVNDNFANIPDGQESEVSKEFGEKMGVTAEDKKKYGPGAKVDLIKPNVKAKG